MKKVAIIGAGISGLVCAWRLIQKGIKPIIFEKEAMAGGRTLYSGAVSPGKFDLRLNNLIKELGLEELIVPLKKENIAFYNENGEIINLNELQKQMKKMFSIIEALRLLKVFHFVNSLDFDVERVDSRLLKLREISFEDFLKKYPPKIAKVLEETACFFGKTVDFNPKVMSAEYGLGIVRLANELQSGKAFTFEENNILTLCNVLAKKIKEKGGQILTLAEVKKVEKEGNKFKIFYEKEGEKIAEAQIVVLNTPLYVTKEIFPQLALKTDIHYFRLKTIFARGKFKYPQIKVIKGNPGNPADIAIMYNIVPQYQTIHCLEGQEVNLEPLYESWEVIDEKDIEAFPVIGPKAKVPDLKTKIEGAYLVGDFYYHTFLEVAVTTAEMVARMIMGEENG